MTKSNIECITPSCVNAVKKYGEQYHRVCETYLEKDKNDGFIALCQNCGGLFDGKVWKHECRHCHKELHAGELTGLFVPHSCKTCNEKTVAEQKRAGHVCRRCRQVYAWCCC